MAAVIGLLIIIAIYLAIYLGALLFETLVGLVGSVSLVVHELGRATSAFVKRLLRAASTLVKTLLGEALLTISEMRIRLSVDRSKKIHERNLDIIGSCWFSLREFDNIDKKAGACFEEIVKREGYSRLLPDYRAKLPAIFRPSIPSKWTDLHSYISHSFRNRVAELRDKREADERRETAEHGAREAAKRERERRERLATEEREAQDRRIAEELGASHRRATERGERERRVLAERQERERREALEELKRLGVAEKEKARTELWSVSEGLIQTFLEIAERKVSIIDDYGDENWDALPAEVDYCLIKIAKRKGMSDREIRTFLKKDQLPDAYVWLRDKLFEEFRKHHATARAMPPRTSYDLDALSGVEFETWVGRLLKQQGFDVRGTSATGDQGADLIAKKDGKTVIVQAKRYKGAVGNKAVQEVIAAVAYYGGDEGWVVTNTTFTAAAKALAQKSDIRLIDGRMLRKGTLDYGHFTDSLL